MPGRGPCPSAPVPQQVSLECIRMPDPGPGHYHFVCQRVSWEHRVHNHQSGEADPDCWVVLRWCCGWLAARPGHDDTMESFFSELQLPTSERPAMFHNPPRTGRVCVCGRDVTKLKARGSALRLAPCAIAMVCLFIGSCNNEPEVARTTRGGAWAIDAELTIPERSSSPWGAQHCGDLKLPRAARHVEASARKLRNKQSVSTVRFTVDAVPAPDDGTRMVVK